MKDVHERFDDLEKQFKSMSTINKVVLVGVAIGLVVFALSAIFDW